MLRIANSDTSPMSVTGVARLIYKRSVNNGRSPFIYARTKRAPTPWGVRQEGVDDSQRAIARLREDLR